MTTLQKLKVLNKEVIGCRLCPRLVHFRETVPAKPIYAEEVYWRKPVPGFGDPNAWLMLIGLAPAPHGGNRTGRPFTGDLSGDFLVRCLYNQGFANQPLSVNAHDGLQLLECYVAAAVKCVPPLHKPTPQEFLNCSGYLDRELQLLSKLTHVIALGRSAFDAYLRYAKLHGHSTRGMHFEFGKRYPFEKLPTLYGCYHPTPRNTNTGTLTVEMFEGLLAEIRKAKKNEPRRFIDAGCS